MFESSGENGRPSRDRKAIKAHQLFFFRIYAFHMWQAAELFHRFGGKTKTKNKNMPAPFSSARPTRVHGTPTKYDTVIQTKSESREHFDRVITTTTTEKAHLLRARLSN
jgi:hypothetical protein